MRWLLDLRPRVPLWFLLAAAGGVATPAAPIWLAWLTGGLLEFR